MVRSIKRKSKLENQSGIISSKKKRSDLNSCSSNTLVNLFTEHGFVFLDSHDQQNELNVDQALLQQKVSLALKSESISVDNVMKGLEELWEDDYRFCFSILPTLSTNDCTNSSRGQLQESLIRLMLGIDLLQEPVASSLLEKLAEISVDKDVISTAMKITDVDLIQLIVNQFKWLDHIVGSKKLIEKVFEVLSVCDVKIQRELISCIPDLSDDENHQMVATQLRDLLLENSSLTQCILEALSNMNFKGELLEQIRETVTEILNSASVKDLPSVVKFLQHSITENNVVETVEEIREKLKFSTSAPPRESSTPALLEQRKRNFREYEIELFDILKSGIKFQKLLVDAWMKVIDNIQSAKRLKVIDVYVIFCIYNIKTRQKSVESFLRNKIKNGKITEEIFTLAFECHSKVISGFLPEVILLSETLLRSNEAAVSEFGCNMYKQAFLNFDTYSQQDIVGALVTHIGSGSGPEMEASFSILNTIVKENPEKMAKFAVFLKGILDYIDNLSVSQIRDLFAMISLLTTIESDEEVSDELVMVIQKQLSSSVLKYKRIGIIGAMMLVATISRKRRSYLVTPVINSQNPVQTSLSKVLYNKVIDILTMVKNSVQNHPNSSSLFYDELANIVEKETLDEKVLHWIAETVVADFQSEYLVDVESAKSRLKENLSLYYDLDEPEEGGIAVNIAPLIISSIQHREEKGSSSSSSSTTLTVSREKNRLLCLPSQFRLVRICEGKQNNSNLEGIDALLGCPLVLYKESVLDRFNLLKDTEQSAICYSLIYAANWIREGLNAFSNGNVDPETRGKIISRVKTLKKINDLLEKYLPATRCLQMPIVDYSIDDHLLGDLKSLKDLIEQKKSKRPKPKKPKKKTPKNQDSNEDTNEDTNIEQTVPTKEPSLSDKEDNEEFDADDVTSEYHVKLHRFPASFRQLDLNAMNILKYEKVSKAVMDSDMHTKTNEELELFPCELNLLLDDFEKKLEFALHTNIKRCFLKQSAVKLIGFSHLPSDVKCLKFVQQLLPCLCNLFENCIDYFKLCNEENDGIVDCASKKKEEYKSYSYMFQVLLRIFLLIVSWESFKKEANKSLLKSLLTIFAKRKNNADKSISKSFMEYLTIPVELIPNITSAVTIVKIMIEVGKLFQDMPEIKDKICEICVTFLQYDWVTENGEKDKGAIFNEQVAFLTRFCISSSKEPLSKIEDFCTGALGELVTEKSRSDEGTSQYPTLTRNSLIAYYRSFFEELVSFVKSLKNVNKSSTEDRLKDIHTSIKLFQKLNSVIKEIDNKNLFGVSLKFSRLFLESFLKLVMPLLDKTLRSHKDIVHAILKTAQQSTRSLQHLCGHSKFAKDVSLTNHVPGLKRCLETFVFRVKAMLAYNNCHSAFWLGNLKNRDLKGNEILSQVESSADQDASSSAASHSTEDLEEEEREQEAEDEEEEEEEEQEKECSESF